MYKSKPIQELRNRTILNPEEIDRLTKCIESTDLSECHFALDRLFDARAWRMLVSHASWNIALKPDSPRAYAYWSIALQELGEQNGADQVSELAQSNCSDPAKLWTEYSRIYTIEGNLKTAKEYYMKSFRTRGGKSRKAPPSASPQILWKSFVKKIESNRKLSAPQ